MKLYLMPILCLLLVGCIDLPPYLDDNDVLESRQYVVDYDQRMQKKNDIIFIYQWQKRRYQLTPINGRI